MKSVKRSDLEEEELQELQTKIEEFLLREEYKEKEMKINSQRVDYLQE